MIALSAQLLAGRTSPNNAGVFWRDQQWIFRLPRQALRLSSTIHPNPIKHVDVGSGTVDNSKTVPYLPFVPP